MVSGEVLPVWELGGGKREPDERGGREGGSVHAKLPKKPASLVPRLAWEWG